jgi:tryptophanyl-tRNA synthetase
MEDDQLKQAKTIRGIRRDRRTEVARSYSYKLNLDRFYANKVFESRDFFCSQKAECSIDEAEKVGRALYAYCKAQVLEAVNQEIAEIKAQIAAEETARYQATQPKNAGDSKAFAKWQADRAQKAGWVA